MSAARKAIRITTDTMGEVPAMGGGAEPTATAALKGLDHILEQRLHRPGTVKAAPGW